MKNLVKTMARYLALVLIAPLYAGYYCCTRISGDRRKAFRPFSEFLSLFPGVSGQFLRRAFYRLAFTSCADSACIGFGTVFSTPEVEIFENVYIGSHCALGKVRIGRDTLLASGVRIVSGLQQHGTDSLDTPIREQAGVFSLVTIGEDCWIGEGALIAADVGDHAIVAAGSVVVKPVSPYCIVAGNPATIVRSRRDNNDVAEQSQMEESKTSQPS